MEKEFKILNSLTSVQRAEFDKDLQELYVECYHKTNGQLKMIKDVEVNMRLNDEVFLKVTFEVDNVVGETGKGRITSLYQYPNKIAYEASVAMEKSLN